jgi:glyoxylase-like metal-dependent hydrolase (beta-lactamase superfamily II)
VWGDARRRKGCRACERERCADIDCGQVSRRNLVAAGAGSRFEHGGNGITRRRSRVRRLRDPRPVPVPGYTADSVCFVATDDRAVGGENRSDGPILTGGMLLGEGSTVTYGTDGSVPDYLRSLRKIQEETATRTPATSQVEAVANRVCGSGMNTRRRAMLAAAFV